MLQIYNTASRAKQPFTPLQPGHVKLYVCGITVYDYCHIGHARTWIAFDVVVRYLRYRGYQVEYVRNITDIDDKIIQRAQERQLPPLELANQFIEAMHEDERRLNLLPPDREPRATEFMGPMQDLVSKLIARGCAYPAPNGDVYFAVQAYPDYGQLSGAQLEDMAAGARVEVNTAKRYPLDFVLWKSAKPGEPSWDSPWGPGRPGWHLECSAMSMTLLGDTFDIHGGGGDLLFPHHENESAQSCAVSHQPLANTWMHVGFLQINQEKMSKSLGNFTLVRDILQQVDAEVVRLFMISGHYRSPLEFSSAQLQESAAALQRLYTALRGLPEANPAADTALEARFVSAMDDDFNTPEALAVLFEGAKHINRLRETDPQQAAAFGALLKQLGATLGLLQQDPASFLQGADTEPEVVAMVQAREQARAARDWAQADALRDKLGALGIELEDTANGTLWRRR